MKKQLLLIVFFLFTTASTGFAHYQIFLPRGEMIEISSLEEEISICSEGEFFSLSFIKAEAEETALERMKRLFAEKETPDHLWHLVYANDPFDILFEMGSTSSETPFRLVRLLNVHGGFVRFEYVSVDLSTKEGWIEKLNEIQIRKE